ncbi:tetracycline resistance MFS efflux pump [Phocicoccus schoeneichii]|uniref:Tetracycline resistance protein, class C n=1 Tax=Phocicoccus schoeneichii TaxID=1812261 RepID=A0A6V7RCP8_9BACL|nr:MFS transporter [Jeotgalicoccus schoeneichii]GGH52378.1 tetracycline resistance MFS efflux pump [Jeotgalicoccus schoeneichii]CAD2074696.1 Tetracycline resistance protein, class C [Jeotgalicoccus schoeneichii]
MKNSLMKHIVFIMLVQFLIYFGFSMIIPVMPQLIVDYNVSTMHLGFVLAIYSIASFISAPFFGMLSDKTGRRPLLIVGLLVFALSFFIFAVLSHSLTVLYITRFVGGMASGALYTATTSMVADLTSVQERTKYMGLVGMSVGFGFVFGPGIGGMLGSVAMSMPFFMTSAVILVALIVAFLFIQETYKPSTVPQGKITMAKEYFIQPVGILLVATFFVMFMMSGMESTFQLLGQKLINITPGQMGVLFFIGGIFNVIVQGGIIRKLKDGQEYPAMIIGQVLALIAFIMLPFMTGLVYAGVCIVLLMSGNALVKTLMTSQITKEALSHEVGKLTATTYSLDSLGRIAGPIFFNLLFVMYYGLPFYFGALMVLLSTFFIYQYFRKRGNYA